jgi:osmotically-inducible protein OsmY
MKIINRQSISVAILAAALFAGCAPTETKRGTAEVVDDATINTKVKAALVADPDVKGTQINVNTYKGVVQLSGFVNSTSEIQKATQKAAEVAGVTSVRNDLQIKPTR